MTKPVIANVKEAAALVVFTYVTVIAAKGLFDLSADAIAVAKEKLSKKQ